MTFRFPRISLCLCSRSRSTTPWTRPRTASPSGYNTRSRSSLPLLRPSRQMLLSLRSSLSRRSSAIHSHLRRLALEDFKSLSSFAARSILKPAILHCIVNVQKMVVPWNHAFIKQMNFCRKTLHCCDSSCQSLHKSDIKKGGSG